jgi:hypothetical protein
MKTLRVAEPRIKVREDVLAGFFHGGALGMKKIQ